MYCNPVQLALHSPRGPLLIARSALGAGVGASQRFRRAPARNYQAVQPPSLVMISPVMNDDASLARNTHRPASSAGSPVRRIGVRANALAQRIADGIRLGQLLKLVFQSLKWTGFCKKWLGLTHWRCVWSHLKKNRKLNCGTPCRCYLSCGIGVFMTDAQFSTWLG